MKRQALSALFLLSATFAIPAAAEPALIETQETVERLDASEPMTIDLGSKLAVVFYYTDAQGDRLLVTAIGPKDPDSTEPATQQIIKMTTSGEYVINFDTEAPGEEAAKLSAYFEGSQLIVAFDKV